MDPQVRTSFIPKKPIELGSKPRVSAGAGIFFFVAVIIFFGSVLLAGAAFLYENQLHKSITDKSSQLATAREQFEPATIQSLIRLDDRLTYSKQIINAHIAASGLFALLAQSTLQTVSFNKFSYTRGEDGTAALTLDGVTKTFSEVALQSDEFSKLRQLKNVIFSDFNVQDNGTVIFSVKANVDPEFLLYRTLLSSQGLTPSAPGPTGLPPQPQPEASSVPPTQ